MRADLIAAIRALRASATFTAVALRSITTGLGCAAGLHGLGSAAAGVRRRRSGAGSGPAGGRALFIGSFVTLMQIDPGFDPTNVLTAQVFPRAEPGQPPADNSAKFQEIVDRISATAGVQHASFVIGGMPLGGSMNTTRLEIAGVETRGDNTTVSQRRVTPAYHRALGIPLKRGRLFEPTDRQGAPLVLIVNESVVQPVLCRSRPAGAIAEGGGRRSHDHRRGRRHPPDQPRIRPDAGDLSPDGADGPWFRRTHRPHHRRPLHACCPP